MSKLTCITEITSIQASDFHRVSFLSRNFWRPPIDVSTSFPKKYLCRKNAILNWNIEHGTITKAFAFLAQLTIVALYSAPIHSSAHNHIYCRDLHNTQHPGIWYWILLLKMSNKIWILLIFGFVIYSCSSGMRNSCLISNRFEFFLFKRNSACEDTLMVNGSQKGIAGWVWE